MSNIPFVDCQGLAGAWTLAACQLGFDLKHRVSLPGGFGDPVVEANRHLLPGDWAQQTGDPHTEWRSQHGIGFLCGTPPCSGFSLLNVASGRNARGPGSAINSCMRELVTYASRCTGTDGKRGPEIVSFESVQQAYTQGRELMVTLRDILRDNTGEDYELAHVLMSGSSVGSAQMRHRYFPVFHRIPFGVGEPTPRKVVNYNDAIGDLVGAQLGWDDQPYPSDIVTPYTHDLRRADGMFDSHVTLVSGRVANLIGEVCEVGWNYGDNLPQALVKNGMRPPTLESSFDPETGSYRGWNWPVRIRPDRPGYVLTGGGIHGFVHWAEPRFLTVREMARLMGYPDNWEWPTRSPNSASMWIGKCAPVPSCRWITSWVAQAIEGNPGPRGDDIGDGEHKFNFTNLYKQWPGGNIPRRVE